MNVLIFGGTGRIGSAVAWDLAKRGIIISEMISKVLNPLRE